MAASADALRVRQLMRTHHNERAVAAVLGVTVEEIRAIRLDPTQTLNLPTGGGGPDGAASLWKPPYGSLKAAVQDPALAVAKGSLGASTLYLTRVYVPEAITLENAHWIVTTQATGLTLAELGVYNSDLELIGRTGDVKAKFNSGGAGSPGPQQAPLTPVAGRSLDVGGEGEWVYVGHHQVGGTARAVMAGWTLAVAGLALLDGSPPRCTTRGSTAALPDVIDPLDIAAGGSTVFLWYGLS